MSVVQPSVVQPNYHIHYLWDTLANNLGTLAGAGANVLHGLAMRQSVQNQQNSLLSDLAARGAELGRSAVDMRPILMAAGMNPHQLGQFLQQWQPTLANMTGENDRAALARSNAQTNSWSPGVNLPTGGYSFPDYQNASPPWQQSKQPQGSSRFSNPTQWFNGGSPSAFGRTSNQTPSVAPGSFNSIGSFAEALIPYFS
jgi:hypothetical protein